jgi:hypothetical protein
MKPNVSEITHHVDNVDETVRMQIDQDSIAHLMQILTDLYSDPILAVIREYSTNALDSHIEAGNKDPIEITLPTTLKPNFEVRDRGIGLNVGDMRDIYSMYGRSTKRSSDLVTGMLGLGCKSGLTYALSFTVTGVKDGLKTIASVTKDSDGVGSIKILDTASTDDENGVTVSIPVRNYDIPRFESTARDLFKYWKPGTVLINGEEPEFPSDHVLWLDEDVAVFSRTGLVPDRIVMGGVPYPFTHNMHGVSIVAWVPMGAVNFTPSREALHFTARTDATIKDVVEFVNERLPRAISKSIEKAKTPYEQLHLSLDWWVHAKKLFKDHWSQQGKVQLPDGKSVWDLDLGWKTRATKSDTLGLQTFTRKGPIITEYPNLTIPPGARERCRQLFGNNASILFLPEGTDLHYLIGRDNVHTWQHVLDNTETPTIGRGAQSKTQYTVYHNGKSYSTHKIDTDDPIVYQIGGSSYSYSYYPEAHGVGIQSRQLDRFKRLHPTAVSLDTYREKRIAELKSQLSDKDKMFFGDLSKYRVLRGRADEITDPDLSTIVQMATGGKSDALTKLQALAGANCLTHHPIHVKIHNKYPLISALSYASDKATIDDLVKYINFKYGGK